MVRAVQERAAAARQAGAAAARARHRDRRRQHRRRSRQGRRLRAQPRLAPHRRRRRDQEDRRRLGAAQDAVVVRRRQSGRGARGARRLRARRRSQVGGRAQRVGEPVNGGSLFAHGWLFAYASVFVGGFLTSLTPCVYPLIPITVSLFGARGDDVPRRRAIALASLYVAGIGVRDAALGVGSALAGPVVGTFMANPWVIVPIAMLFIAMAASMFGAFELALPTSLQTPLPPVGAPRFARPF